MNRCTTVDNLIINGTGLVDHRISKSNTELITFEKKSKSCIPVRFLIVLLGTWATAFVFSLRVNISVAIVAMVNSTGVSEQEMKTRGLNNFNFKNFSFDHNDECIADGVIMMTNNTNDSPKLEKYETGSLLWSQEMQGIILGGYYYGYAVMQVIGGRLAEKYSPRYLCGYGLLTSAVFTMLTPLSATSSVALVLLSRIIIGVSHGFVYTSLYCMCSHWFPKNERPTALALVTVGGNIGAALTMPLSSYLSEYGFGGGWPSVYYVTGAATVVWFVFWIYFVRDHPEEHFWMTMDELNHIRSGLELIAPKKGSKAPWGKIFRSKAVWSIAVAKSCGMFGYYTLSTRLPGYLQSVLHIPIQRNGSINAFVWVAVSVSMTFAGPLSAFVKRNSDLSLTAVRKIFQSVALFGTALCLAIVPIAGCDENVVVSLLLVAMLLFGFTTGGDIPIVADIAPHFSGTIFGITNTISCSMGFLAPIVIGVILKENHRSLSQWSLVFYCSSVLSVLGNIVFLIWAEATPAHWGVIQKPAKKNYLRDVSLEDNKCVTNSEIVHPA